MPTLKNTDEYRTFVANLHSFYGLVEDAANSISNAYAKHGFEHDAFDFVDVDEVTNDGVWIHVLDNNRDKRIRYIDSGYFLTEQRKDAFETLNENLVARREGVEEANRRTIVDRENKEYREFLRLKRKSGE